MTALRGGTHSVHVPRTRTLYPLLLILLAGCRPDLGVPDEEAARELVYDREGVPAFAGQALVIQSCGAGGFCHSDDVVQLSDRFGAPAGLGFDLTLASTTVEVELDRAARLRSHTARVIQNSGWVWEQVASGRMPPDGEAGERYRQATGIEYTRFDDAGAPIGPLPGLDTEEGRAILRNWLAMGDELPVVERTHPPLSTRDLQVGVVVPICERNCVDPTFESIYEQILIPSCARSRCHDSSEPAADLTLSGPIDGATGREARLAVMSTVLSSLTTGQAMDTQCRGRALLVAGDPLRSLLYQKVSLSSQDVCGSRMPLAGNPLSDQRLCAIREWIACGACGPGDASCDACIATARETCGVAAPFDPMTGFAQCEQVTPCANHPDRLP